VITFGLNKEFVRRASGVHRFFGMNIRFRTVVDHGVLESHVEGLCEVDTKLDDLAQGDRNLLLVDYSIQSFNHASLLNDRELEQGLVELLALRTKEDGEEII
jgi:hypothetical protein